MRIRRLIFAVAMVFSAVSGVQAQEKIPASKAEMQLSFAPLVEATAPSVVNVYAPNGCVVVVALLSLMIPSFSVSLAAMALVPRGSGVERSLGSGVIVAEDGVVVTNHHVIAGATDVHVALANRQEFDAEVILADEKTRSSDFEDQGKTQVPALSFANSDDLRVGDLVLAIGNPFGVGQTVTSGIVSALARTQVGISDYQFFIQTDAASILVILAERW